MRHFTYQYGSLSDAGDVRSENQDAILCCTGEKNTQNQQNDAAFFLVADGMGGLSYGSQVSAYCTDQFTAWWHEDFSQMMQAGRDSDTDIKELLEQEIWISTPGFIKFKEREGCRCGSTFLRYCCITEILYRKSGRQPYLPFPQKRSGAADKRSVPGSTAGA